MNYTITTWLNHQETGAQEELNNLPSETQPDMTMSLEQLLIRHTKGQDIPIFQPSYQEDDQYIPNPKSLDLTDIQQMKENTAAYIQRKQDEHHRKYQTPEGKPQTSEGQPSPEPTQTPEPE